MGSLICGTEEFIYEARRNRKLLGGGMRQAGVIAAAGIIAIEEMVDRLAEDNKNAARLRRELAGIPGLSLYKGAGVLTNITYVDLDRERISGEVGPVESLEWETKFMERLDGAGIRILRTDPYRFRLVTHHGHTEEDVDKVVEKLSDILGTME